MPEASSNIFGVLSNTHVTALYTFYKAWKNKHEGTSERRTGIKGAPPKADTLLLAPKHFLLFEEFNMRLVK